MHNTSWRRIAICALIVIAFLMGYFSGYHSGYADATHNLILEGFEFLERHNVDVTPTANQVGKLIAQYWDYFISIKGKSNTDPLIQM